MHIFYHACSIVHSQHQNHWCFLFLSNLFNSLKTRHIVHTQHCKYVHIKYVQTLILMTLMLTMYNGTSIIGRSRGACWVHAPPWDPILLFLHTFLLKSAHVGGPRPPNRSTPPHGKSWICH